MLPMILVAKWCPNKDQAKIIKDTLTGLRPPLKDKTSGTLQTWLQTLLILENSPLPDSEKARLATLICQDLQRISTSQTSKDIVAKELSIDFKHRCSLIQALLSLNVNPIEWDPITNITQALDGLLEIGLKTEPSFQGIANLSDVNAKLKCPSFLQS
jgi:hypothetical protein